MNENPRAQLMRFRSKELLAMVLLLVIGEVIGIVSSYATRESNLGLAKIFAGAAITLFFGALLGGVVTLLIADFDRRRLQRAAQLDFSSNVLADLKSVYDRVDRGRTLIRAHRSAKTYGEEMRNFIEARVKLLNVVRALKFDERGKDLTNIGTSVMSMEEYLKTLIDEYEQKYKDISQSQNLYEVRMKYALEKSVSTQDAEAKLPENTPWDEIARLESVADFMTPIENCNTNSPDSCSNYCRCFLYPLDDASERLRKILRDELA
jgi:hypothetical protein